MRTVAGTTCRSATVSSVMTDLPARLEAAGIEVPVKVREWEDSVWVVSGVSQVTAAGRPWPSCDR